MTKKLQAHVDDQLANQVETEAARRDLSTSAYIRTVLETSLRDDELSDQLERTDAERRVEELVATGRDELLDTVEAIRGIVARGAVYQIAMWELQKRHYSWHDKQRRAALATGSERLREPLEELGVDVDVLEASLDGTDADAAGDGEPTNGSEEYDWLDEGESES